MSRTSNPDSSRVALVTGASAGIGQATARALMAAGYQVFGTYRKEPPHRIEGVQYLHCDVTSDESVAAVVAEVMKTSPRIDLLVNNAGIGLVAGAEESSVDQAKALFDVNLFGAIRMAQAVLPAMRRQRSGRIVNLSSILGVIPSPYSALYASTKHAMEGYFESLDHEVRAFGIRAVLVEPAYTRTTFEGNLLHADRTLDEYAPARNRAEAQLRTVMQSADTPETVAAVVVRAAQEESPQLRYTAGSVAKRVSLLRRFVPAGAFDKSLRKQLGL